VKEEHTNGKKNAQKYLSVVCITCLFLLKNNSDYSSNLGILSFQELQFPLIALSATLVTPIVMIRTTFHTATMIMGIAV
jgi:hypothetical protein